MPLTTNIVSWNPVQARCTRYNIMWWSLSVTCDRSVVFSKYSSFLHQWNWPPRYHWNIFESVVKQHKPKPLLTSISFLTQNFNNLYSLLGTRRHHNDEPEKEMSTMADSLTSHQYKSYIVSMVHRLRTNTEVQLGKISLDLVTWHQTSLSFSAAR